MSESIGVWRGATTEDPYGNPVQGTPTLWASFAALVAPNHPEEPAQVGRAAVITGYTIYIEGAAPTGILPTDLVEVRGVKLPVDGIPASWYRKSDGAYRGDQVAVKVVDG